MKKIKCLICGKTVSNNNTYIGTHTKAKHNLGLWEYIEKYYKNLKPEIKKENCGFCEREAIPKYVIDHDKYTYFLNYDHGYFCQTIECKETISLKIFNEHYNSKRFEHIGANVLFLSGIYKISIEEAKKLKYDEFRIHTEREKTNLAGYIIRYGEIEGPKKYKERNQKIGKANTLTWYKEKYGDEEGEIKYTEHRRKIHKKLGATTSRKSYKINEFLNKNNIFFIPEYKYENATKKNGSIDFYLEKENIIIEFYGDYWHCNPNVYKSDYYHKILKRFAYEIWEKDKNRIDYIFNKEFKRKVTILIIWESTKFTEEYLLNLLKEIKRKYTIFEI